MPLQNTGQTNEPPPVSTLPATHELRLSETTAMPSFTKLSVQAGNLPTVVPSGDAGTYCRSVWLQTVRPQFEFTS